MAGKLITCHFLVTPVTMKNRFSIIKEQERLGIWRRAYVHNNRFSGQQIFWILGNTITSHSISSHNIACFATGMHGKGISKHPG
jgi:hypothetical protein